MIKEEFMLLSSDAQEEFINSGGVIEDTSAAPQRRINDSPIQSSNTAPAQPTNIQVPSNPFLTHNESFDGYMFDNPYELLLMVDDDIFNGYVKCHEWQIQIMKDFAECVKGGKGVSDDNPFQGVVRAANGSGKDQFIIAACVAWLSMRYKYTTCAVTSASGQQLDRQTCKHLSNLALRVNTKFKQDFGFPFDVWDIKYREYTVVFNPNDLKDKSSVYSFATDEPRKAEGYHPTKPGAKLGIFVSEDKTVPDDINVALNKCTGYTHRLHVSTPGLMLGHFYDYCQIAPLRETINSVNELQSVDWVQYHIPARKCSHLKESYFKQMERDLPGGKNGAAYRSQIDAEFSSAETSVVIPFIYIHRALEGKTTIKWVQETFNTAGLDLSDGGDETVMSVRNGNKLIELLPFKFEDTQDTIAFLHDKFEEYGLKNAQSRIWADCGGIGKPMLDTLKRMGWRNIRYVDNRSASSKPLTYLNRGTELFFSLRDKLEYSSIILIDDDKLKKQLGGRYYKLRTDGRHQLLSKQEQKSKGYPSPDRADSVNLCFWNYENPTIDRDIEESEELVTATAEQQVEQVKSSFDLRVAAGNRKDTFETVQRRITERQINFSSLQEEIDEINTKLRKQNAIQ